MYTISVCCLLLITLYISAIETKPYGSKIKNSYHYNSDNQPLLENNESPSKQMKGKQLWDDCMADIDCFTHINNSECLNGICQCRDGFRESKNKDDNYHNTNNKTLNSCYAIGTNVNDKFKEETTVPTSPPQKTNGSHMLPIMIVLGIMFIGMCVALNLFSRAQFRNNRSLFTSNSHIVKTGKRTSSHRRTSSTHPTTATSSVSSQHRVNSTGSGSFVEDSSTQKLKTTANTTECDTSVIKPDRQERTNRVLDNCISATTVAKVNLMTNNQANGMNVAALEVPTAPSSQL